MNSTDETAVLDCLERLCAIVMALSAYGANAPQYVRDWADKEVGTAQEIRDRLRPEKPRGIGATWWKKPTKE